MKRTVLAAACAATLLLLASALPAAAVSTQTWSRAGALLRAGTLDGMVVTPDGRLAPAPRARVAARPPSAVLWSLLADGDGAIVGAGERGGALRIGADGATTTLATFGTGPGQMSGAELFALARVGGTVYAATGPRGALYALDGRGGARKLLEPQAVYVWALAALPDGALAVATGLPGKVLRVAPDGAVRELWSAPDDHVRSLAIGPDGALYAGTAPHGLVARLDGKGNGFVLYDAERPETVALAVDAGGTLWAAFAGSPAKAEAAAAARPAAQRGATVEVTVRASGAETTAAPAPKTEAEGAAPTAAELPQGGGTLVRIAPNDAPEQVWADDRETPLALLPAEGGGALLGAANGGKIWWFDAAGKLGVFDERKDYRSFSALAASGGRIFAAASNPAALIVYGPEAAERAVWTSDVFDARSETTLGRARLDAEAADAGAATLALRVGETAEPGPGWTPWTVVSGAAGPPDRDGGFAPLPRARFLQARIEIAPRARYVPQVGGFAALHRPANRAPKIEQLEVLPQGVAVRPLPPPQFASGDVPIVAPPRTPDLERALAESALPWRGKRAYEPGALTIVWEARDADNDELRAKVDWRRDDGGPGKGSDWKTLAEDVETNYWSFDGRSLPDGVYRFRVTVSDARDNAAGEGREASRESAPSAIDNTPPTIERAEARPAEVGKGKASVERGAGRPSAERGASGASGEAWWTIVVAARDPGGRLAKAEISAGDGSFIELPPPASGIGAVAATWEARIPAPRPGERPTVRVVDAAGNASSRVVDLP